MPYVINHVDGSRGVGGDVYMGSGPPWKITSGYTMVSVEILVWTPLPRQLGPIASRGRFIRPSLKYVNE